MPAACQCLPEVQELPVPAVLMRVPPAAPAPQPHRPSASLPAWVLCRQLPVQQEGQSHATPQSRVPQPCPARLTPHGSHTPKPLWRPHRRHREARSPTLGSYGKDTSLGSVRPVRSLFPPLVLQVAVILKHQLQQDAVLGSGQWGLRQCRRLSADGEGTGRRLPPPLGLWHRVS